VIETGVNRACLRVSSAMLSPLEGAFEHEIVEYKRISDKILKVIKAPLVSIKVLEKELLGNHPLTPE
jgi:hypothetical protein